MKKDLVEIIKANPGCVAIVDNDCWSLHKVHPYEDGPDEESMSYEAYAEWEKGNKLADDGDVIERGSGYGAGNCYGGDILQALAEIVGIRVESV